MKLNKIALSIVLGSTLVACGGGSSNTTQSNETNPTDLPEIVPPTPAPVVNNQTINGQLVVPISITTSARRAINPIQARSAECPNVPDGYLPLNSATVELKNAAGENVGDSVATNTCGEFTFVVAEDLVANIEQVVANKEGFKSIISDIENFLAANAAKLVSTAEADAVYELTGFRKTSDNSVNFIITDSKSKKAVIGLPESAFSFSLDALPLTVNNVVGSQNIANDSTTLALALDSSGSMDIPVSDANGAVISAPDGNAHTRYSLVASSTHQLVDMTKANDPNATISVTLFSSHIYPLVDETITEYLSLFNVNGDQISYSINSPTGFVNDTSTLHTLIDLYSPQSEMYDPWWGPVITRHEDRVDSIASIDFYPFSGGTAFYDAIDSAINQLVGAQVAKPAIVALTDGEDNTSVNTPEDIIAKANQYNIPVTVIAAGDDLKPESTEAMQNIAAETGSAYFDATNIAALGGFLAGISTRVTFNYNADFSQTFVSGQKLTISLTLSDGSVVTYPEQVLP
ncbi:VWA domain-containing protein [Motilimonas sp. E26]|uniref:vWA domain-containing protein n=1 Tax=Motilimonas sp. E26 TaxID=2865674 RepID=UPI001E578FF5|nr:VWA domain-containing protein [Motilimonas sp. E26]MCE0556868.1 VWA domain-containing protein [Motilimonas sp. E26]